MSALWPVQAAVYGALTGDVALMAVITGVHDGVAVQGAAMPYVVLGSATENQANTFGRRGWSDTLTIHVWSKYPGRKQALEILDLIDTALAGPLAISRHQTVRLRREFAEVLVDRDGARHVPARYRVTTRET